MLEWGEKVAEGRRGGFEGQIGIGKEKEQELVEEAEQ